MPSPVTPIWNIGSLLTWTTEFFTKKAIDEPRLSAELLLGHALGCTRMALYTQYERVPEESQLAAFRAAVRQRAEHVPVAYLIGKASFFSLDFIVTPDVLIPRPDTETLVENVIQRVRQTPGWETPALLDLCTGSGCIAIALAKHLAAARLVATDLSEKALTVARTNAQNLGVAEWITFLQGDLFGPLADLQPSRMFHAIVSNPPYIATSHVADLPATVRDHEPRTALDGGLDGLDFHRRIVAGSIEYLEPGGLLALEIAFDQAVEVQAIFVSNPRLENVRLHRDAAGHPRCVLATRKSA